MTPNEFITENYDQLLRSANNISGYHHLSQESLHYAIEEFLQKKNVNEIVESGGGTFYIISILIKCWRSTTSTFYRKNLKPYDTLPDLNNYEEDDNTQELYELAIERLNELFWYDRMLFQTFVEENHTISSLARETGIPRTSVSLTIHRVRNYLKKELKKSL